MRHVTKVDMFLEHEMLIFVNALMLVYVNSVLSTINVKCKNLEIGGMVHAHDLYLELYHGKV